LTFAEGDVAQLAERILEVVNAGKGCVPDEVRLEHLAKHAPSEVALEYLRALGIDESAVSSQG
jgi:hypothetical protein